VSDAGALPGARTERTLDEIAHEAGSALMDQLQPGQQVGVIILSGRTGKPGDSACRTVWRFVHCPEDPATQAKTLREVADMIEGKLGTIEPKS
jgi:hypothetical protein